MKQYYHKEDTPLKFHKFFRYVSLPLGFFILLIRMISEISEITFFDWFYAVDIGYYVIALTLMLVCFVGFFKWKSYAWYGVMIYLCIGTAYNMYGVAIYAIYIPDQIVAVVGQVCGYLAYAIMVSIYYRKRRPLFFSDMPEIDVTDSADSVNVGDINSPNYQVFPQAKCCHKCGCKLSDGSEFCSKCGTPIMRE
jgi:hypothetical protein